MDNNFTKKYKENKKNLPKDANSSYKVDSAWHINKDRMPCPTPDTPANAKDITDTVKPITDSVQYLGDRIANIGKAVEYKVGQGEKWKNINDAVRDINNKVWLAEAWPYVKLMDKKAYVITEPIEVKQSMRIDGIATQTKLTKINSVTGTQGKYIINVALENASDLFIGAVVLIHTPTPKDTSTVHCFTGCFRVLSKTGNSITLLCTSQASRLPDPSKVTGAIVKKFLSPICYAKPTPAYDCIRIITADVMLKNVACYNGRTGLRIKQGRCICSNIHDPEHPTYDLCITECVEGTRIISSFFNFVGSAFDNNNDLGIITGGSSLVMCNISCSNNRMGMFVRNSNISLGNTITSCNNIEVGLYLSSATGRTLNMQCTNNGGHGVRIEASDMETEHSTFDYNGLNGLAIRSSSSKCISCTFNNNKQTGIFALNARVRIDGSIMQDNTLNGVYNVAGYMSCEQTTASKNGGNNYRSDGGVMGVTGANSAIKSTGESFNCGANGAIIGSGVKGDLSKKETDGGIVNITK